MLGKATLRGLLIGVVGGLLGTILMDIVMIVTFLAVGESADFFFTMVGKKLGDGAIIGVAIHNMIGMSGGFIFATFVLNVPRLRIDSTRKGLLLGVGAGAITIPLGCIPLAIWLGEPIVPVIAFSLLPHLVWGTVLGWTMAYGLLSSGARTAGLEGSPGAPSA